MTSIEIADGLDAALDRAARDLNNGSDLTPLTMRLLGEFGSEHQNAALRFIVDETLGALIAENCLLDETADNSHAVQAEVAYTLAYAIAKQGRQLVALRELVAGCIERRAEVITALADQPEQPYRCPRCKVGDHCRGDETCLCKCPPEVEQCALFPSAPRAHEYMRDPN